MLSFLVPGHWVLPQLLSEPLVGLDVRPALLHEVKWLLVGHFELVNEVANHDARAATDPVRTVNEHVLFFCHALIDPLVGHLKDFSQVLFNAVLDVQFQVIKLIFELGLEFFSCHDNMLDLILFELGLVQCNVLIPNEEVLVDLWNVAELSLGFVAKTKEIMAELVVIGVVVHFEMVYAGEKGW